MKATDLMIGDYIQDLAGDLCQVIVIDRQVAQVETLTGVHQGDTTRYLDEAEGVSITPEILEKNGFPYDNKERLYYPFSNKAFAIERDEHDDRVFYYSMYVYNPYSSFNWHEIIEIRYVHELQHALKLCGIEKEIVLQ